MEDCNFKCDFSLEIHKHHITAQHLEHKQQIVELEDVKNQVQKLAGHCSVKLRALIE